MPNAAAVPGTESQADADIRCGGVGGESEKRPPFKLEEAWDSANWRRHGIRIEVDAH